MPDLTECVVRVGNSSTWTAVGECPSLRILFLCASHHSNSDLSFGKGLLLGSVVQQEQHSFGRQGQRRTAWEGKGICICIIVGGWVLVSRELKNFVTTLSKYMPLLYPVYMSHARLLKSIKIRLIVVLIGDLLVEDSHSLLKLFLLVPDERTLTGEEEVDLLQCSAARFGKETVYQRHVSEHRPAHAICQSSFIHKDSPFGEKSRLVLCIYLRSKYVEGLARILSAGRSSKK